MWPRKKGPVPGRLALGLALGWLATDTGAQTVEHAFRDFVIEPAFGGHEFDGAAAVRFALDGTVFVAERSGIILIFEGATDSEPAVFADLRTSVYAAFDRGLLGLAVHPDFPNAPYVYALYTHDALIGGTAPLWGDACPTPPGASIEGCVVSSRLVRLQADGDVMVGAEQVLIEDWCQQFPSHSAGDLNFGPDGALYVSHGEGASFQFVDIGQVNNPCADPLIEGGALRAQDLQTPIDPVGLHGSILRVHPITGQALPDNPLFGGNPGDDRHIAYGLRNPFRHTFRPGTSELWIADVGWNSWEELNRIPDASDGVVENFGWPCYEGQFKQPLFDEFNLPICESLYAAGSAQLPYYAYPHNGSGGHAISGLAFYAGGAYPDGFDGALFLADFNQAWIRVMFPGPGGLPNPAAVQDFIAGAGAVDLQIGPEGDLYFVQFTRQGPSTVQRVVYAPPDRSAAAWAACLSGPGHLPSPAPPFTPGECLRAFDWDSDDDVDLHDYAVGLGMAAP